MGSEAARTDKHYPAHVSAMCERHDRALEAAGADWVAIPSGSEKIAFLDDRTYPFIPNPHFVAWLPLTEHPGSAVVYRRGKRPLLLYLQPRDFWHMPPAEPAGVWVDNVDVRTVTDAAGLAAELPGDRDAGMVIGEVGEGPWHGIGRVNPEAALNLLHNARTRKTAYELACMRLAQRRAVAGHRAAHAAFAAGESEYGIQMAYLGAMKQRECEMPYNNIVALNEHAAVLHYQHLGRAAPPESRSFLIDAGATCAGYAADITRSYAAAPGVFADLLAAMEALQLEIVAAVRAGADYRSLHLDTHRRLARVLVDADLASGSVDALVERRVTYAFFPHGLGHFLGVQVHDVGGLASGDRAHRIDRPEGHDALRLTRRLEADQVLTIEPGLYFIPMLLDELRNGDAAGHLRWDNVEALLPYGGIRIEDNVRVLADGCENLTRDAFAEDRSLAA
ncbi:MAG: Xaa-Pro dipeptidase [Pseudomonadota bacterium]